MPKVCPPSVVEKDQVWVIFVLRTDLYQYLYYYERTEHRGVYFWWKEMMSYILDV